MKKKEIKEILRRYKYKMVPHSWYVTEDCAIFYASDDCGMCHQFYVNWEFKKARRRMLAADVIFNDISVAYMFFGEV